MVFKKQICVISALILMAACSVALYLSWVRARNEEECKEVARKGGELFGAINTLIRELEPRGIMGVWPKTDNGLAKYYIDPEFISVKTFNTAESYFEFLLDGTRIGQSDWEPYIRGIDYSHLAGAGVPIKRGGGKLLGENTMWCILANRNLESRDDDNIPVLVTRNVDVAVLEAFMRGFPNDKTPVVLGKDFSTPFGDRMAIIVTFGGKVLVLDGKNLTVEACFDYKKGFNPWSWCGSNAPCYLKPSK